MENNLVVVGEWNVKKEIGVVKRWTQEAEEG